MSTIAARENRIGKKPERTEVTGGLMIRRSRRSPDMHYPRRVSKIKKVRKSGFRARMRTKSGRKIINRRRKLGRRLTSV